MTDTQYGILVVVVAGIIVYFMLVFGGIKI